MMGFPAMFPCWGAKQKRVCIVVPSANVKVQSDVFWFWVNSVNKTMTCGLNSFVCCLLI